MKKSFASILVVVSLATMFFLGRVSLNGTEGGATIVSSVQAQVRGPQCRCGIRRVIGSYGFSADGTNLIPPAPGLEAGPTAAAGVFTIDEQGAITLTASQSFNGTVLPPTEFTGTVTVDANCTGTATFTTGATFFFALVDDGEELRFMQTNDGTAVSGVAKRICVNQ